MTKVTKGLLVSAIVSLAGGLFVNSGLVDVDAVPGLYVLLPAGAIFLGMFLISRMLQHESAQYEQEHHGPQTAGDPAEPLAAVSGAGQKPEEA
jgi:hypothetical protein